jgi:glucosamine-6-phosphate deaminase
MLIAVQPGTRTIDGATVHVLPDVAAMARAAADEALAVMQAAVASRGTAHVMFATGNSQLAFVDALVH